MADVFLSCVKSRPRAGRRVQGGRRTHVNVEQGGRPAGPSGSGYVAKFRASDAVVLLRGAMAALIPPGRSPYAYIRTVMRRLCGTMS